MNGFTKNGPISKQNSKFKEALFRMVQFDTMTGNLIHFHLKWSNFKTGLVIYGPISYSAPSRPKHVTRFLSLKRYHSQGKQIKRESLDGMTPMDSSFSYSKFILMCSPGCEETSSAFSSASVAKCTVLAALVCCSRCDFHC